MCLFIMSLQKLNSNFNSIPKQFEEFLADKWVAILDGEIISSGYNFKEVFLESKNKGLSKRVLFHKVPKKEIIIM